MDGNPRTAAVLATTRESILKMLLLSQEEQRDQKKPIPEDIRDVESFQS